MNKHITFIFRGDFPEGRVENARLKALALGLKPFGWKIDFLPLYPTCYAQENDIEDEIHWNDFTIIRLSSKTLKYKKNRIARVFQILKAQTLLVFWILKHRKDKRIFLFYSPQWIDSLLGLVLTRFTSNTSIVDHTDLHSLRGNRLLHQSEEWVISKFSDQLLVISNFLFKHFRSRVDTKRLKQLTMVVDFDRFSQMNDPEPSSVGYIGSFGPKDGVEFILNSIALIKKSVPEIKLFLIGNNPKKEQLNSLIDDLDLSNNVAYLDKVTYESIPSHLTSCGMFIMNRDGEPFSLSGFPTKLGEYFACKRPVLLSDIGEYSEDFQDKVNVLKYKPNDMKDLSDKIITVLNEPSLAQKIGKEGYRIAKSRYSKEYVGALLNSYLEEIELNK